MTGIVLRAARAALFVNVVAIVSTTGASAQEKHYRFAYDQPKTTAYGIAADIFADKLKEVSKGTMIIEQYPGGQLGQETQALQLLKSGDIDFSITSSANTASLSPQIGVMSLHFLFRSEDHLSKAIADPRLSEAVQALLAETVQGARMIGLSTSGLRSMYAKKEISKVEDLKGLKVRVQATATEDAIFPAYGAQTVHMPFGSVYTSIQTGVIDAAENSINAYHVNKHYEVAPVFSLTEHEANNSLVWISEKLWQSLNDDQKKWVMASAAEVGKLGPGKAFDLEHGTVAKLKALGVKVVTDIDKSGFIKVATPFLEKSSAELGPHAVKIVKLVGSIPSN
jgi:TRAP-type transport system periplasmic protein